MPQALEAPNVERAIADHLRDELETRVVYKMPGQDNLDSAWILVTILGDRDVSGDEYLFEAMVQLDCYASEDNGVPEVTALGARVRQALKSLRGETSGGIIISEVRFAGHARVPDPDFSPDRQRIVLTAMVTHHGSGIPA